MRLAVIVLGSGMVFGQDVGIPLFNGINLNGWGSANSEPGTWTVRDGVIICSGESKGYIGFQSEHSEAHFRNIRFQPLKSKENWKTDAAKIKITPEVPKWMSVMPEDQSPPPKRIAHSQRPRSWEESSRSVPFQKNRRENG